LVIVIDGPAGSGKTTTAKSLAQRLGYLYLDTGAMYRALTLKALRSCIDCTDTGTVARLANSTRIQLEPRGERLAVILDGEDVTNAIRSSPVDKAVSSVAMIPEVRRRMVEAQREMARGKSVVAEGRDMGTVVFPDADLKVFLVADIEERARRRWKDVRERGESMSLGEVREELRRRDTVDSKRATAPLCQAPDAVRVDTTSLTIPEQVAEIMGLVASRVAG
jgi:cytidylate kinase